MRSHAARASHPVRCSAAAMARTDAALAPAHHDEASRISSRIQHVAHPACILELPICLSPETACATQPVCTNAPPHRGCDTDVPANAHRHADDRPRTVDHLSAHRGAQVPEPGAPRPARSGVEKLPTSTNGARRDPSSRTEDAPRVHVALGNVKGQAVIPILRTAPIKSIAPSTLPQRQVVNQ
jgi:hypothetical protein